MIDYGIIQLSANFYEDWGNYKRIETPWTVSEAVDNITKPIKAVPYKIEATGKHLVASGEQSFLYLYLKEFLPRGRFQTITPCFRNENFDYLHSKYFIKNELIDTETVTNESLDQMVKVALDFYQMYLPEAEVVKTELGFDIEIHGRELGSYGIRKCEFLEWIYGTGCAEPRLSNLIKLYGVSHTQHQEGCTRRVF